MHSSMHLLFVLSLIAGAYAAIGPTADLDIVNRVIAPDGFNRSYVSSYIGQSITLILFRRTVLAGGTFPGPLIQGVKACIPRCLYTLASLLASLRATISASMLRTLWWTTLW